MQNTLIAGLTHVQICMKVLNEKPIISSDFAVNYRLFRILSVGAVGGFTHFQNPVASGLKLGGVLRLNPVKNYQGNIFVQVAGFLPLSTLVKPSMGKSEGRAVHSVFSEK